MILNTQLRNSLMEAIELDKPVKQLYQQFRLRLYRALKLLRNDSIMGAMPFFEERFG